MSDYSQDKNQDLNNVQLENVENDSNEAKDVTDSPPSPPSMPPAIERQPCTPPSSTPSPPSSPRQEIHSRCLSISSSSSLSHPNAKYLYAMQQKGPFMAPSFHHGTRYMNPPPPYYYPNPNPNLNMAFNFPFAPYFPYSQRFQPPYQMWPEYNTQVITRRSRTWTTGPLDCLSDIKNSFITMFCACFTFGQIAEIINEGQTPWWENAILYSLLEGLSAGVATGLYVALYRVKMRDRYSLRGTIVWDLIFSILCTRLSLCQQYRQLDRLGILVPLGWEANKENYRRIALESMHIHHRFVPPLVEPGMYR